jgi:hypothetical protein
MGVAVQFSECLHHNRPLVQAQQLLHRRGSVPYTGPCVRMGTCWYEGVSRCLQQHMRKPSDRLGAGVTRHVRGLVRIAVGPWVLLLLERHQPWWLLEVLTTDTMGGKSRASPQTDSLWFLGRTCC